MTRLRAHWPFAIVLCAITATRAWFTLSFPIVQVSDYRDYYVEAQGFAGLRPLGLSALFAHGPKLLYSVVFRLFGDDLRVIGATNTVLYAVGTVVLYAAVARLFDRQTAVLTAAISMVSLSELYFNNLTSTEVPSTLCIAVILLILSRGLDSWRVSLALGVAGGLAVYFRSNIFPMGALALVAHWVTTGALGAALKRAALVQLVVVVVALPLCIINLVHFHRFTPLIANAETLWFANNPRMRGDFHNYQETPEHFPPGSPERIALRREFASFYLNPDPNMEFARMNPYEVSAIRLRYAIGWIRQNPGRYLHLVVARFQLLFFSCTYGEAPYRTSYDRYNPEQPRWLPAHERLIERARLPIRRLYQILIAGGAVGLLVTVVRYRLRGFFASGKWLPFLFVVYYSIPFLLFMGANRYHIPILGLCWVYLAHGLVILGRFVAGGPRGWRREAPPPSA